MLRELQQELVALLQAQTTLAGVTILAEDQADLESALEQALAAPSGASGRHGAAIVVQVTSAVSRDGGESSGPYFDDVQLVLRCVEMRLVNRDVASGGTGISALELAEIAATAVARENPTAGTPPRYVEAIRVADLPPDSGLVGYDVVVRTVVPMSWEDTP